MIFISLIFVALILVIFVIYGYDLRKLNRNHNFKLANLSEKIKAEQNKESILFELNLSKSITDQLLFKLKIITNQLDLLKTISNNYEN